MNFTDEQTRLLLDYEQILREERALRNIEMVLSKKKLSLISQAKSIGLTLEPLKKAAKIVYGR
ncbi:MAG: hypothetical protein ACMUIP_15470 [bacterium]